VTVRNDHFAADPDATAKRAGAAKSPIPDPSNRLKTAGPFGQVQQDHKRLISIQFCSGQPLRHDASPGLRRCRSVPHPVRPSPRRTGLRCGRRQIGIQASLEASGKGRREVIVVSENQHAPDHRRTLHRAADPVHRVHDGDVIRPAAGRRPQLFRWPRHVAGRNLGTAHFHAIRDIERQPNRVAQRQHMDTGAAKPPPSGHGLGRCAVQCNA